MFKDEVMGKQIEEFVKLRPKLYSYKVDEDEVKKCKWTKKNVVKKRIEHKDLKNCLFTGLPQMRRMNIIRSRGHQLFTEEINKVALSAEDHKSYPVGWCVYLDNRTLQELITSNICYYL